ncbi:endonuclease domain-containing 1 protein [Brienomyrus brachyistius]|uniref:endonuclease domain-containing 1 protein n=1 Tax=Brienomyrus brachyistius TaxID=42636 RepID=UPI0020B17B67|nr:endonuclease domain-containing 1 protein [Brienomyrus brachyistius]
MSLSAAGVRSWILAGLCFGMSVRAGEDVAASECTQSFHKGAPPAGFGGEQLQLLCHSPDGALPFATLYDASSDVTVYLAFNVAGGPERVDSEGDGQDEEDQPALPLSFLRPQEGTVASSDTHAQSWDATVLELVQTNAFPRCQSIGGDLYVLTGPRPMDPFEKGGTVALYWLALCCAALDEERSFSFGVLDKREEGARVLGVGALQEELKAASLFPGGCGDADGAQEWEDMLEKVAERFAAHSQVKMEEGPVHDSAAAETENDSDGPFRFLLSSALYLVSVPFWPAASKLVQLPEQVSYVLQEELGILSAVPYDTFLVSYNIISDAAGGVSSVGSLLGRVVGGCGSLVYSCTSPLVETLITSFMEGVTGMGVLAGDGVGIFGGLVNTTWSASTLIGGTVLEQGEGYVWALSSELGSQVMSMGTGLGKLLVKGGRGVSNVVSFVGVLLGGAVDHFLEAFGNE